MKKEKKTFKATLANGEVVTLKTWGMCWAASKTVDLDVVKIEEICGNFQEHENDGFAEDHRQRRFYAWKQ